MKILHIIGNGFDLNLGLKSSYSEFYKYYQGIKSEDESISDLKRNISADYNSWSDLEVGLGEYTEKVNDSSTFEYLLTDIGDRLAEYLENEEKQFDSDFFDLKVMYEYIIYPENSMPPAIRKDIVDLRNNKMNEQWLINIVTFNYTRTIEKILKNKTDNIQIGGSHNTILESVNHIHGYTNNRMILGVNDPSQILNKGFQENEELIEAFVKDEYNQLTKQLVNDTFHQLINEADIICIFGSSLGPTDNIWWQSIAHQLKKDIRVVIFHWSSKVTPRWQHKIGVVEREMKKKLTTWINDDTLNVSGDSGDSKILVCVNSKMFSFDRE